MKDRLHIGIDFDNTIVTYDDVFHKYALLAGLIPPKVRKNKQAVRDYIRRLPDGEKRWTKLQGLVYTRHMGEARPAAGVEIFLAACRAGGARVSIISHKTVYPAIGPRLSLRQAARRWIRERGFLSGHGLKAADVVFVGTLREKLAEIARRGCTHFIDDLTEVLTHPDFPGGVERILYAPGAEVTAPPGIVHGRGWRALSRRFFG